MKPMRSLKTVFAFVVMVSAAANFCRANEEVENYLAEWKGKCEPLLAQWRKSGKTDATLRQNLIEAAVHSEQPAIVEEVLAGGDVAALEIAVPSEVKRSVVQSIRVLENIPPIPYGTRMDCVLRRMTKTRFEAWTPAHGWLFNAKGELLNEAHPPRRDGIGREWHGAFLPDGCWVTTDLWEMDKTLSFFSKNGKWVKEIRAADLAPAGPDDAWSLDLIGWARCDKQGTGWVVSVGDGPGRAQVFITPAGKPRLLDDVCAPWKLCYSRDLEPKGMYTALMRPSDDFTRVIHFSEAGHGTWVGYPTYMWTEKENDGVIVPGGDHNFGFLPGSKDVFIGASEYGEGTQPRHLKTWFFDAGGKCRGWVRGEYLADTADGKRTLWRTEDNSVLELDSALKPRSRTSFVIKGAETKPVKLLTDLRVGFFSAGSDLVLARW